MISFLPWLFNKKINCTGRFFKIKDVFNLGSQVVVHFIVWMCLNCKNLIIFAVKCLSEMFLKDFAFCSDIARVFFSFIFVFNFTAYFILYENVKWSKTDFLKSLIWYWHLYSRCHWQLLFNRFHPVLPT